MVDVQQFIASHRTKLNEEKIRLQERTPRGILPSGSQAVEQAARLRQERESEYHDYLKTRPSKTRSIVEVRREMALERDKELSSRSDTSLVQDRGHKVDYDSMKERRMAEERLYRRNEYGTKSREDRPSVGFKDQEGDWESEEKDLVSWARQQHSTRQHHSPLPSQTSHRSISAPTNTTGGITMLGGRDDDREAKRNRQREYAESLRAQMREKINNNYETKPMREKMKYNLKPEPTIEPASRRTRSPEHTRVSPQRIHTTQDNKNPPTLREHQYPPYPNMYQHYPLPPMPHPYYMPSYYPPPPPRGPYYSDRPDPYSYPYYPPREYNPYMPLHVPAHVATRPYDDWKETDHTRQERNSELRKSDEKKIARDTVHTSPIHGGFTKGNKLDKMSYRRELEQQMREKKERELKAKIDKERYEIKKATEIYDPFGKGGGGAPVRDQAGNIVADLKRLKRINDERSGVSPRTSQEFPTTDGSPTRRSYEAKNSPQNKTVLTYDKLDSETHKKVDQESYREYLRRQVQEKEERKRQQKEAQKLEEQKELERLEKDQLKMDSDLRLEREKERLTEVDLKKKNQQLKKEAEERLREYTIKQRELLYQQQMQEKLQAELKKQELADKMSQPVNPYVQQQRSRSPPIPTIRKQQQQQGGVPNQQAVVPQQPSHPTSPPIPTVQRQMSNTQFQPQRSSSPPVPTIQRQHTKQSPTPQQQQAKQRSTPQQQQRPLTQTKPEPTPPTESSILAQLAAMRMHLQAQLTNQMKSKEAQPPSPKQTTPLPRAIPGPRVRQPQSGALAANVEKFSSLKYKSPFPNQEFLSQFPDPPRTESALEVQQGAMLRYQEERLARLQNRDKENKPSHFIGGALPSSSDRVPFSSVDPFHNNTKLHLSQISDYLSVNKGRRALRNTSAGGQSQFSIATVDVDGMAGRNEERMRRLDAILNAGTSSRGIESGYVPSVRGVESEGVRGVSLVEDSESILNNFLKRSNHDRPSLTRGSEKSLECETAYQRLGTPGT